MNNLRSQEKQDNTIDEMEETSAYMTLIRGNLDYEYYMSYASYGDKELFEEIYETVCDVKGRQSALMGGLSICTGQIPVLEAEWQSYQICYGTHERYFYKDKQIYGHT